MYWMVAFKIHRLMNHYLNKRHIEGIMRFENHFYHECFSQYFKDGQRVSSFPLNNLHNEVRN